MGIIVNITIIIATIIVTLVCVVITLVITLILTNNWYLIGNPIINCNFTPIFFTHLTEILSGAHW